MVEVLHNTSKTLVFLIIKRSHIVNELRAPQISEHVVVESAFTLPSKLPTGTLTFSMIMYAVPAEAE